MWRNVIACISALRQGSPTLASVAKHIYFNASLGGGLALQPLFAAWHNCIPRIGRHVLSHSNKRIYPGMDRLRRLLSLTPTAWPRNKMTTGEELVLKKNLLILAVCCTLAIATSPARAQDETEKAIEKYRQ